jgi:ubiquitin carboxyl-terminal hydrolase 1
MMNGDHASDSSRSISPGISSLANLGNTCFLNSVLYTLRFTPGFCHSFHHLHCDLQAKVKQENGRTSEKPDPDEENLVDVIHSLHQLFHKLCISDTGANGDPKDPVLPTDLLHSIVRLLPAFDGNQQHDAQELLNHLLTNLQDVKLPSPKADLQASSPADDKKFKKSKHLNQQQLGSTPNLVNSLDANGSVESHRLLGNKSPTPPPPLPTNFIKDNFVGVGVRRIKCLECESSTYSKEEFNTIQVPVQCDEEDEDATGYNVFISRIMASETVRDANKYTCSECSRNNEAQLTVSYEQLPSVLVLHLNRFAATASRSYVSKLTDYMPTPLLMDCFCQKCRESPGAPLHRYRLYSVILHLGASLASGHYITCVRAGDVNFEYFQCRRPGPVDTTLRNKNSKRSIFKMFSKSSSSSSSSLTANSADQSLTNQVCGSISCCGIKCNPTLCAASLDDRLSSSSGAGGGSSIGSNGLDPGGGSNGKHSPNLGADMDDIWLECDDEQISVLTRSQLEDLLTSRQTTTTPYLLFYNKI